MAEPVEIENGPLGPMPLWGLRRRAAQRLTACGASSPISCCRSCAGARRTSGVRWACDARRAHAARAAASWSRRRAARRSRPAGPRARRAFRRRGAAAARRDEPAPGGRAARSAGARPPGAGGHAVAAHRRAIAAAALELAALGPPPSAREAVNRHSLLARLPEIVRVDRTVHFWLGRQTVRRAQAAPAGDGAARAAARAGRTDQPELAARDRHPGGGAAARSWRSTSPARWARRSIRCASSRRSRWGGSCPCCASPRWRASSRARRSGSASIGPGDALADALYRFASFHDPPPGTEASPDAVGFALRFLAHLVWLDVLFGTRSRWRSSRSRRASIAAASPGVDLAVMLTAASRTARTLVWPADVPEPAIWRTPSARRLDALGEARARARRCPEFAAARRASPSSPPRPATRPAVRDLRP